MAGDARFLTFHPVLTPAATIGPSPALADKPLKPQPACGIEEIRADLALLERVDEDTLGPPREQALQVGLAHRQGHVAQALTSFDDDVEGAELHLVIML